MAKIINITDKLDSNKPQITLGEKTYTVNNSMNTVLKFEESAVDATKDSMYKAIEIALGEQAAKELDINEMSMGNFKVLATAVFACMLDVEYDEAAARFQKALQ